MKYLSTKGVENKLNKNALFFEIPLGKELRAQEKIEIKVKLAFNHVLEPLPKEITQGENQKVVLSDSAFHFSCYSIKSQKATIKTGTSAVESYTSVEPSSKASDSVVYGPYSNKKAFEQQPIRVHYQNNKPFALFSYANRILEVSHWGNLAVEEHFELKHVGAALKGGFSRLDYAKNPYGAPASFKSITATLPLKAADIYYRDRIGNISTSDVRASGKNLEVEFLPRFPMFGGWKTVFYMGYNVPLSDYLSINTASGKYELKYQFTSPFQGIPADEVSIKVILPEGASSVEVDLPFEYDEKQEEVFQTYLDISGRKVVIIKKKNVSSPEHSKTLIIRYDFPTGGVFQEPLLVIGGLFTLCLFIIGYGRLDLSIGKTAKQVEEELREKDVDLVSQYIEKHLEREQAMKRLYYSIKGGVKDVVENTRKEVSAHREIIEKALKTLLDQITTKSLKEKLIVVENKVKDSFGKLESAKATKELEKEYGKLEEEIYDLVQDIKNQLD